MPNKPKTRSKRSQGSDDFYEMMPNAYMGSYEMFPAENEAREDLPEDAVRRRMVRQLLILVGLLLIQFILFAVLIQSTVNLT